jgi:hypothetical protein
MSMDVFRDILDKQLRDAAECKMGRVDGIVARVRQGAPPVIEGLELGMTRVAERVHRPFGRWIEAMSHRLGVRRTPRYVIPWSKVASVSNNGIRVMVDAESEASSDWEWWFRKTIVERIPGGKSDTEEK